MLGVCAMLKLHNRLPRVHVAAINQSKRMITNRRLCVRVRREMRHGERMEKPADVLESKLLSPLARYWKNGHATGLRYDLRIRSEMHFICRILCQTGAGTDGFGGLAVAVVVSLSVGTYLVSLTTGFCCACSAALESSMRRTTSMPANSQSY